MFNFLLPYVISDEKSVILCMFIPVYIMSSLAAFMTSFYHCFYQFMKCLAMIFFVIFISLDKLLGPVGFNFYHLENFYPLIISDIILTHPLQFLQKL